MYRLYQSSSALSLNSLQSISCAHFASKAMAGYSHNNKPGPGKRLGLKKSGGQEVRAHEIIARQRGFKWRLGENVYAGSDQTIHAAKEGIVVFSKDPFTTGRKRTSIHVIEQEIPNRYVSPPPPFMFHPELQPEYAALNPQSEKYMIPIKRKKQKTGQKNNTPQPIKIDGQEFDDKLKGDIQFLAQRMGSQQNVETRFQKSFEMVESLRERLQTHDYF